MSTAGPARAVAHAVTGPAPLREARIDLGAIERNVRTIRERTGTMVMGIVKADGYGHGAIESARAMLAGGAAWLGVVELEEALALRAAGIQAPLLAWLHAPGTDFAAGVAAHVDIGVNYLDQLEEVAEAPGRAEVQLKVDTGLGRNGAVEAEWDALFARAAELERLGSIHVRGIFSHLSNTSDDTDLEQVAAFERALGLAAGRGLDPKLRHIAATCGALAVPESRFDLVRIGIGAYGLSPMREYTSADLGLTPAMTLTARIAAVKRVPAGSGVSYGHSYRTDAETTLALVPAGYADGIPRHASNAAPVSIGGRRYRIAGRVAMDQFVVDVGDAAVAVGDEAVLFGDPAAGVPGAVDWADAAGTIDYEIVSRIGGRIRRRYLP
ncbi:MAG: alanine racemase [Microbacteriaceae bacterium]